MKKLQQKTTSKVRKTWIAAGVLLLIVGAIIAGFFAFGGANSGGDSPDALDLSMETPARVTSGEAFDLVLTYTNQDVVELNDVAVTFQFPSAYTLQSADPESASPLTWKLGTIAPGETARLRLHGDVIGETGATLEWGATIAYMPANFSSTFSQDVTVTSVIGDSIIGMSADTPLRVVANNAFDYELTLTNNAERALADLRVEFTMPEDLVADSLKPQPLDQDRFVWSIEEIEAGEEQTISFEGLFSDTEGDSREVVATALLKGDDGFYKKQAELNSIYFVLTPTLDLSLKAEGSSDARAIDFGEQTEFVMTYKNASEMVYLDVALMVEITDLYELLDLSSFEDNRDGEVVNQSLMWTSATFPELERIEPGRDGSITFTLDSASSLLVDDSVSEVEAVLEPRATASEVLDIDGYTFVTTGDAVSVQAKTTTSIQAEGRYYDENLQPVGSGPLPPQVGKTTTYQIGWTISNTLNPLGDVTVTSTLPDNVTWKGNTDVTHGSPLSYDAGTRKITWTISNVGVYAGLLRSAPEASFDVSITPEESDIGRAVKLTTKAELRATDAFTGEELSLSDPAVTTELENDLGASGKGRVVAAD